MNPRMRVLYVQSLIYGNQELNPEAGAVRTSHHEWWAYLLGKPPKGGWVHETGFAGPGPFRVLSRWQTVHSWPGSPASRISDSFLDFHQAPPLIIAARPGTCQSSWLTSRSRSA